MRVFIGMALALATACAPPPPQSAPPQGAPPAPSDGPTECGAPALQRLVGRYRNEVPPRQPGRPQRVYARGDPITMDFSPHRLNIEYDGATGRIVRVYCG